jgi:hypothetical protein
MMQVSKRDTLIITLALGITLMFIIGSIIRINGFSLPHTILHVIGVMLSIFLIGVSIQAYKKTRTERFLLLIFGFIGFVIVESINLIYAFFNWNIYELNILQIELPHILGVYILMLLVISILRGAS